MTRDEWAELAQCMKALDAAKRKKLLCFLQDLKAKDVMPVTSTDQTNRN